MIFSGESLANTLLQSGELDDVEPLTEQSITALLFAEGKRRIFEVAPRSGSEPAYDAQDLYGRRLLKTALERNERKSK